jgi:hypothetical protein
MKTLVITLTMFMVIFNVHAQQQVPFDETSVMIDGRITPGEWDKALACKVNDSTTLYFKQDRQNIFICVHISSVRPAMVMVDLFITDGKELVNLHSSAKLGERTFDSETYGDFSWWNNDAWTATIARLDKIEERRFLRDEAKEFQLSKSRFDSKEFRLMFEIIYPVNYKMHFPIEATNDFSKKWLQLKL